MIKQQQKGFSYYEVCTSDNPTYNLVFINGFAGTTDALKTFIHKFDIKRYNCYLLNLPGFGEIPAPMHKPMSTETLANYVYNFITKFQLENVVLVGHSYGAIVCEYTADLLYTRDRSVLKNCILMNPTNYIRLNKLFTLSTLKATDYKTFRKLNENFFYNRSFLKEEFIDFVKEAAFQDVVAKNMRTLRKNDFSIKTIKKVQNSVKKLKVPTLVFLNDEDVIVAFKKSMRKFKQNEFVQIQNMDECGHITYIEKADEAFAIIDDFLYPKTSKINY